MPTKMKLAARMLFAVLILSASWSAFAAKVIVSWTNPTSNVDGSPLVDLAYIQIQWGTCNGSFFGSVQSAINIPQTPMRVESAAVYPSGLARVCIRAYAVNTMNIVSDASNVASKDLLPAPSKPVRLGQPVILTFNQQ